MPTPYSEPGGSNTPSISPPIQKAISRASDAVAKASAGSLGTRSAVSTVDFQPDTTDQPPVQITGLAVPIGAKLLIWATFSCNVNPAESGGAANTITVKVRVNGTPIDSLGWQQDLKLSGVSSVAANNFFTVASESAAFVSSETVTVDFTIASTVSLSDTTPAGTARITVQIVGS